MVIMTESAPRTHLFLGAQSEEKSLRNGNFCFSFFHSLHNAAASACFLPVLYPFQNNGGMSLHSNRRYSPVYRVLFRHQGIPFAGRHNQAAKSRCQRDSGSRNRKFHLPFPVVTVYDDNKLLFPGKPGITQKLLLAF